MLGPELRFAPKKPDISRDLQAAEAELEKATTSANKKGQAESMYSIASLFSKVKKFEKALEKAEPALAIFEELGDKTAITNCTQMVNNLKKIVEEMKGPKFEMFVMAKKAMDAGDDYAMFEGAAALYGTRRAN
mmetsp:Transcript_45017/g.101905  ORF Transcript_45017/g.101905 Transcript_45017/m.101905 type:complete len:133 (+) Transcript_45017:84-482(+)